ncbi:MAG: putative lipid II flippase FtsW [Actinomycetota bacterium]
MARSAAGPKGSAQPVRTRSRGATRKARQPGRHLRVVGPGERPRTPAQTNRRFIVLLLGSTAALTVLGLVMVLSASSVAAYAQYGSSFLFAWRQALYGVVGVGVLVLCARMPYGSWRRLSLPFFAVCVLLLLMVLHPAAGTVAGGSSRWLAVGPVTIQPSEFVKLAIVALVAGVLAGRWKRLDEPSALLFPIVPLTALVCVLIMLQPDLGTTLIVAGTVFILIFLAGVRLSWLVLAGAGGGILTFALIASSSYRWDRFTSFLNPWGDPQNTGYHLIQSLIALGSGGLTGEGLGASRQKWLYVPNAHTDFIFSILGEELGLLGAMVTIGLFAVFLYAGVRIAGRAPDPFGRLLAGGIVAWLGLQILINLGAVTGLLPITGVPLPLISAGGSSLIVSLAAIGILVSIARRGTSRAPAGAGSRNQARQKQRRKRRR